MSVDDSYHSINIGPEVLQIRHHYNRSNPRDQQTPKHLLYVISTYNTLSVWENIKRV